MTMSGNTNLWNIRRVYNCVSRSPSVCSHACVRGLTRQDEEKLGESRVQKWRMHYEDGVWNLVSFHIYYQKISPRPSFTRESESFVSSTATRRLVTLSKYLALISYSIEKEGRILFISLPHTCRTCRISQVVIIVVIVSNVIWLLNASCLTYDNI